ncbi:MAG: serine/threonine protein kinase [Deltaproteobacteria bacterium]|nr:serine/threonine protein kinase [Deltaproteobacteria bacterium]
MTQGAPGKCPGCGTEGPVGALCAEKVCTARGYHFVPADYWSGRPDALAGVMVGEYLVVDRLGEGGFGKVYLTLQMPIGMKAALKVMHLHNVDPDMAEGLARRFQGEAAALATLSHPNIVRLLKYGMHEGTPYLVMEFVAGGLTLKGVIRDHAHRRTAVPIELTRAVVGQTLNALQAAHERSIVHRDVKPENVMLQPVAGNPNLVKVLDFGLAKFVREKTETSLLAGTPVYMAPEQLQRANIGPWTDLYALGAMTFELMTGRRPFAGQTPEEILATKLDATYDPMMLVADQQVPQVIAAFLRRSLAVSPADRFRCADEFREAFDALGIEKTAAGVPAIVVPSREPSAPSPAAAPVVTDAGLARKLEEERERLDAERRLVEEERARVAGERDALRAQRYNIVASVASSRARKEDEAGPAPPPDWEPPVRRAPESELTLWKRVQRRSYGAIWAVVVVALVAAGTAYVLRTVGVAGAVGWLKGVVSHAGVSTEKAPADFNEDGAGGGRPGRVTAAGGRVAAPIEAVVASEPPGARVSTGKGLDLGAAPVKVLVPEGGVELRLTLPGHQDATLALSHEDVARSADLKVILKRR